MGGTKLECYVINVLVAGEKQQQVNDSNWGCTRQQQQEGITATFSFHNFQGFLVHKEEEAAAAAAAVIMDSKPPNTTTSSSSSTIEESIRKTMQMHEDIFQHQVRELHRLYTIQKTMMKEEALKKKQQQQQQQTRLLCWNQYTTSNNLPPPPPPNQMEEDQVLELTLSIGGGQSMSDPSNKTKKPKRLCTSDPKSFTSSLSLESDRRGRGDVPDNSASTTETSDKDKKRPFWLFQL